MATVAERKWMSQVAESCIVCYLFNNAKTPAAVHHLLTQGGRRIGHMHTIGLCDPGHHKNPQPGSGKIARHPTKARFEEAYGTEEELWAKQKELINRGVI